jgi:hypothetical protein
VVADEFRETRSSYTAYKKNDKTRTSNTAITEAARQVSLALQAIAMEEKELSQALSDHTPRLPMPYHASFLIPTIVTSASLFTCEFEPAHIDPLTGEMPYAGAKLIEKPYLIMEYALPRNLQMTPFDKAQAFISGALEGFMRMHIVVITSRSFADFLRDFATNPALVFS